MKKRSKTTIDYTKILSQRLQSIPAWRDFAQAVGDVVRPEIDEKRKLLTKMRDSTRYRRGDSIANFKYEPTNERIAVNEITREVVQIPRKTIINEGIIKNVINNITTYDHPDNTDYIDIAFLYDGIPCRWLKAASAVQEREILLKNSYIMGFDFFNTKLNDEDLKRLYDYIQLYWEESGSDDNFMKFIGFIKNIRFDLVALWTETPNGETPTDPNEEYPYLETFNPETMTKVIEGGNHWQTSHVEIQYDLAQFQKYYVINLDDIEQLFYYFAPIMLVLERVTGLLSIDTPICTVSAATATNYHADYLQSSKVINTDILSTNASTVNQYSHDYLQSSKKLTTNIVEVVAISSSVYNSDFLKPTQKIIVNNIASTATNPNLYYYGNNVGTKRYACLALDSRIDLRNNCFDFQPTLATMGII